MNQTVKRIVDLLFEDTVENEETRALHEELMNNCQEHYEDLTSRGLTEDEATEEVVDSLKGMKELGEEYDTLVSGVEVAERCPNVCVYADGKLVGGFYVRHLFEHVHQLREVEKLRKPCPRTVSCSFRGQFYCRLCFPES